MSGIHLFRSNRVEVLVEFLAAGLARPGVDALAPIEIVVGSRGMERYLRHALAERLGVCANVEFPFPTAALDAALASPTTGRDPWSPEVLVWALADVLQQAAESPGCEPLAGYLDAEGSFADAIDARGFGLAHRLADLFDRYVTYRPEMACAWSAGGNDGIERLAGQAWQPLLWRRVRDRLGGRLHRAERLALQYTTVEAPLAASVMRVFALSSVPLSWLEGLAHVARGRDVELYLLVPSDAYAADLGDTGHPLLTSWGRVARDLQRVLEKLPDEVVGLGAEVFPSATVARDGSPDDTALHLLQEDIRAAGLPQLRADFAERDFDPHDRSIQLHDCHGAVRQVEVLRDVLLGLFEADPTLQPRDVVVMTPEIDAYAPVFASVFDRGERAPNADGSWPRSGTPHVPYEIVDLTMRRLNPVADALLRVLGLVDGRATASEVLDLLALEPVSARFGFDGDEVARVRGWAFDAGVRWGADAAQRASHDQPEDSQNTWRFGLDRLLLGVVMRDDGRQVASIRPFEAVEGSDVRLLGGLSEFCDALFSQVESLRAPRSAGAWVTSLEAAVADLTRTSGRGAWLTRRVRDELAALADEAACAGSERLVAVSGIRAVVEGRFDVAAASVHGSGGAVSFCGMVPERSVPHRVVCLIGLDEGSFPRQSRRLAFDLTGHPVRVGDRDVRDEDRYLLLEAVLSARDHLVVLFTGHDARTNKVLPPAVPVSELCDALDRTWPQRPGEPRPSEQLTTHHPLQAFDARNFIVDALKTAGPWTFDRRLLNGARAAMGPRADREAFLSMDARVAPAEKVPDPVNVDELVLFWRQPLRGFLRSRIGLALPWDGGEHLGDREPIELGWIDHADLLRQVLDHRGEGHDVASLHGSLRGGGALPLGQLGEITFDAIVGLAVEMQAEASRAGWKAASTGTDLDLSLASGRLVGRISDLTTEGLVAFAYGAEAPGALLDAWIRLLALQAQTGVGSARARVVFGSVNQQGRTDHDVIGLESLGDPRLLDGLVAMRAEGLDRPLQFFPKSSHAFAKVAWGAKDGLSGEARDVDLIAAGDWEGPMRAVLERAGAAALAVWRDTEHADRYHHHAFGDVVPFVRTDGVVDPSFAALACRVWGPILDARRTAKAMAAWGTA